MMMAAAYGGLAIGNTGCAVAHNIGHALGSLAGIPHGRAVSVSLVHTLGWTMEGNPDAFDAVADVMGVGSKAAIADALHEMADSCGQSLSLSAEEKAKLDAQTLADDMRAEANIAMLEATARDASQKDVESLAISVLEG